jgi:hypothetical protein
MKKDPNSVTLINAADLQARQSAHMWAGINKLLESPEVAPAWKTICLELERLIEVDTCEHTFTDELKFIRILDPVDAMVMKLRSVGYKAHVQVQAMPWEHGRPHPTRYEIVVSWGERS